MNDPNGQIYFNGEYHLYYQYNPYASVWGHMSWGHAVSKDLIHWEHLPVAIPEDGENQIFSGCTIIDKNNTSGFCDMKKQPDGCLLAIYTAQGKKYESQAIAYSNDNGRSFTQYKGNPIINLNKDDFRDPKVYWYEPHKKWIMILALSTEYKIRFYSSKDLINWTYMSDFYGQGCTDGDWEDPDFFELTVEGTGQKKWVVTHAVFVNKVQYYIGDFDGYSFKATDTKKTDWFFIDYGRDFDEATTWTNEPKGRRLMIGWLSEGTYGGQVPTTIWRGSLTLIRELKLRKYQEGIRIVQGPIDEMTQLRYNPKHWDKFEVSDSFNLVSGGQVELIVKFIVDQKNPPKEFGIKVFSGKNQSTVIGYHPETQNITLDRTKSGKVDFAEEFPGVSSHNMAPEDGMVEMRVFVDNNSVELFANRGKIAMSSLIFPDPSQDNIELYVVGGKVTVQSVDLWLLKSIWN